MKLIRSFFRIKTFSPVGFLCWATFFFLFYLAFHLAGWREHTTFITGTATSEADTLVMSAGRGLVYMMSYFGFVLVVPILVLAAGIFRLLTFKKQTAPEP